MVDPAITAYFDERKEAWQKKKTKTSMEDAEIVELQAECEQVFSLEAWLPNAANRAGQMSMATHPCTFSHPSARKNKNDYVTPIIDHSLLLNDGFLRGGNVSTETDALGNAAAIDVYKFLTLEMADKKPLFEHIKTDSELAKAMLKIESATYSDLKAGFLAMMQSSETSVTSSKLKQIYFPVSDSYHLLSLLTNSGIVFQLRERIDAIRFSDDNKLLRECKRKNEYSEDGFMELYNLTTIGYGGTKPQNISVLNNKNGGKAHLLQSTPPKLEKRKIRFPKSNFFSESFQIFHCRDVFEALHKIIKTGYNNKKIREGLDYRLQELLDRIVNKMWSVRSVAGAQFHEGSSNLKKHQKVWLCDEYKKEREESDDWFEELIKEISIWIVRSYEKAIGKQAKKLGPAEQLHIFDIVSQNKEALR